MIRTTLAALAEQFDAFLIDQFGVLLNGTSAYPFAPLSLSRLAQLGKPILLLSNSGKRAVPNEARLTGFGFARDAYLMVMSSGEAAHSSLAHRIGASLPQGAKVWLHARDNDTSAVDGLALTRVASPEQADLLLLAGSQADRISLTDYRAMLAPAAHRQTTLLCTNPDIEMLTPTGTHPGAGAIAQIYSGLGGPVEWIGKPYPLIYAEAARCLPGIAADRILCIGDSPEHDIAGGHAAGHKTALVRTGLYGDLTDAALAAICAAQSVPDFILPAFDLSQEEPWPSHSR